MSNTSLRYGCIRGARKRETPCCQGWKRGLSEDIRRTALTVKNPGSHACVEIRQTRVGVRTNKVASQTLRFNVATEGGIPVVERNPIVNPRVAVEPLANLLLSIPATIDNLRLINARVQAALTQHIVDLRHG